MLSADKLLTDNEVAEVNEAVSKAETNSGARIVPVLASCSGRYEWAEDLVGLWAAALGLALTWAFISQAPVGREWAAANKSSGIGLLPVLAVVVIGFVGGAVLATRVDWLRRLFVPRRKRIACVRERGQQIFNVSYVRDGNDNQTPLVVIYVSIYEKCVEIISDDRLNSVLGESEIQSVQETVLQAMASNKIVEGLKNGIQKVSDIVGVQPSNRKQKPKKRMVSHLKLMG